MNNQRKYRVLLLPQMETVERACSLREATAWTETYNRLIQGEPNMAVIADELSEETSA